MTYLFVFLGSLAVDLIPVVAPPAWTVMAFLLVKYHLNPWLVLAVGVPGSALGRYFFSLYIQKFSSKVIARQKQEELRYVGKKLDRRLWQTWLVVFGYTLSPLSTTALFTAVESSSRTFPISRTSALLFNVRADSFNDPTRELR